MTAPAESILDPGRLLSPDELEQVLGRFERELTSARGQHGRVDRYRWAYNGIDGVASQSLAGARGRRTDPSDLVPSRIDTLGTVKEASRLFQTALRSLQAANSLLAVQGTVEPPGRGRQLSKFERVRQADHEQLVERQAARARRGEGYGTS